MKFEQQISLQSVPSWAAYYLDYITLKRVLYAAKQDTSESFDSSARFLCREQQGQCAVRGSTGRRLQKTGYSRGPMGAEHARGRCHTWKSEFGLLLSQLEILNDFAQTNVMACRRVLEKADLISGQSLAQTMWPTLATMSFASLTSDQVPLHKARAVWRRCTAIPVAPKSLVDNPSKTSVREITSPTATVSELDLNTFPIGKISRVWVALAEDGMGLPIRVPVMIAKGTMEGPIVGITAALHGNELNGIPLIHKLFRELDPQTLHGILVAVPVSNSPGYLLSQRGYSDGTDLNRVMPGKPNGSGPQVYAHNLIQRIVRHFEYLVDLHTASRGRINSLYVRANLRDPRTARMARLQNPQIIVHNTSPKGSMRGAAVDLGIPAITVEIGDPSTFNETYGRNALIGVTNILAQMNMLPDEERLTEYEPVVCSRSYWIFAKSGGILTVHPELAAWVRAGDLIATVHNVFGDIEEEYYAPQDGVIVGKHVDPVCQSGNRILHLGVVDGELQAVVDDGHM
ncbi:hypothetical protein BX661DRAFT_204885 [Kickxella alabastrina]|uniref:uncharacterized protein n=1 Tax=Kickxella alabastrina TaxID=61397 RepID=UPI0022201097|nr:uncharacterized protein BX661DRAFT_204885 [Kickxella alabastrina]KAI7829037.1 hypothetical protein BX661DRAFT_204885 [Kickxella alabastrina]